MKGDTMHYPPISLKGEEWKQIPIDCGMYWVSNKGRVWSWNKRGMLRQWEVEGYANIDLWENGERIKCKVHQLVALSFIGPVPDGMVVDHINRNRYDNRSVNLRYIKQEESDRQYSYKHNPPIWPPI